MALGVDELRELAGATSKAAWQSIMSRAVETCSAPLSAATAPSEVTRRDREIGALDHFLAAGGWDLWKRFGEDVERTSDRLARWWAELYSAKAVLRPLEMAQSGRLDDADLVLVSAVDDLRNPQNVDVYLFPAADVRRRFQASYDTRISNGHKVRDNYGMWVMLDKGDNSVISRVGHSLAVDYPCIARFTLDELEIRTACEARKLAEDAPIEKVEAGRGEAVVTAPQLATVADVLRFARQRISGLTNLPLETVQLELKVGI